MAAGTWQLHPQKQGGFQDAVSALDAARVLEVVSGKRTFDALQTLACDVTGNGTVSALDATRILQLAVGKIDQLPVAQKCGSDWVFVPQAASASQQLLMQPQPSAKTCQTGGIAYQPLQGNALQQDFTALVFGDCTGNWQPSAPGAALQVRARTVRAYLGAPRARPGGRWLVPVYVQGDQGLEALTAHVDYDPAQADLEAARPVGPASGAMMSHHADTSGLAAFALASAQPISPDERPLAVLVFRAAASPQVQLLDAVVDETDAAIGD